MKALLSLCIIALAWVVGYLAEPQLRPYLLPKKGDGKGVVVTERPAIDLNKLAPHQVPERVTLMEDVPFVTPSKLSITIPAGTSVKVSSIQAGRVYVSVEETNATVGIPFEKTNLMEQVVAMLDAPQPPTTPAVVVEPPQPPPIEPPVVSPPEPQPVVQPPPPVEPPVTTPPIVEPPVTQPPVVQPPPVEPPPVEPAVAVTPPAPVDDFPNDGPATPAGTLDDNGLVQLMQQHIKSGSLKTFTFEQVTSWKAGPTENINGTPVQTGTVTYTHQTIFGPKQLTAKAYMLKGRVLRWVWPESGLVLE